MATCLGDRFVNIIDRTECIGNSLVKINNNFTALDIAACTLESQVESISGTFVSEISAGSNISVNPSSGRGNKITVSVSGVLDVVKGGTGGATKEVALNNLLPTQSGNTGRALVTDGSNPSWVLIGAGGLGTVTSVTGISPVTIKSGTSSTTPEISLGTVPIGSGGTGATSATAAINNLLPSQTSNAGKILSTSGTNISWITAPTGGGGGISSVSGISPITVTSGTVISLGTVPIANGGTGATDSGTAFNSLAPSQAGQNGKYLSTNGSQVFWSDVAVSGSSGGTVTNVTGVSPITVTQNSTTPEITLGTIPAILGGTGQTTYSNGQLLIGNSTGTLTKSTLTAGTGISVTNGNGSVTITNTAPGITYTGGTGISVAGTVISIKEQISIINPTTEINILYDTTSIGTGTNLSLEIMRDFFLKQKLMPFYNNNESTYNSRVSVFTLASLVDSGTSKERVFNAIKNRPGASGTTSVINIVFQDEAHGDTTNNRYHQQDSWRPTTTRTAAYNTDISAFRSMLASKPENFYKTLVFCVERSDAYSRSFENLMYSIKYGIGNYSGASGLSDYFNFFPIFDTPRNASGAFYMELLLEYLSKLK